MSEITRYEPDVIETNDLEDYADCVPAINGEYVRYEDHARLLAEKEAEVEALARLLPNGLTLEKWRRLRADANRDNDLIDEFERLESPHA